MGTGTLREPDLDAALRNSALILCSLKVTWSLLLCYSATRALTFSTHRSSPPVSHLTEPCASRGDRSTLS